MKDRMKNVTTGLLHIVLSVCVLVTCVLAVLLIFRGESLIGNFLDAYQALGFYDQVGIGVMAGAVIFVIYPVIWHVLINENAKEISSLEKDISGLKEQNENLHESQRRYADDARIKLRQIEDLEDKNKELTIQLGESRATEQVEGVSDDLRSLLQQLGALVVSISNTREAMEVETGALKSRSESISGALAASVSSLRESSKDLISLVAKALQAMRGQEEAQEEIVAEAADAQRADSNPESENDVSGNMLELLSLILAFGKMNENDYFEEKDDSAVIQVLSLLGRAVRKGFLDRDSVPAIAMCAGRVLECLNSGATTEGDELMVAALKLDPALENL